MLEVVVAGVLALVLLGLIAWRNRLNTEAVKVDEQGRAVSVQEQRDTKKAESARGNGRNPLHRTGRKQGLVRRRRGRSSAEDQDNDSVELGNEARSRIPGDTRQRSNQGRSAAVTATPRDAQNERRSSTTHSDGNGSDEAGDGADEDEVEAEPGTVSELDQLLASGQRPSYIGVKKWRRLLEKRQRKLANEAKRQQLEAERARREEEDAAAAAQRSAEAAKDRLLQEEAQRLLAEQQRKDQEEYNAAKSTFVTEAEGSRAEELERESQTLLQQFVEYITMHKVVALEQLAAHFELRTQDAIDRLAQLQHMGRITGVTDDRGKFIYITPQELEAVASFIQQRGRVSIDELAENSNKLIALP